MRTRLIPSPSSASLYRLVDNVCMICEKDFIERSVQDLESECFTLGNTFDNGPSMADLFEEDKAIAVKRLQLEEKKTRVTKALGTLRQMAPECVAIAPTLLMSDSIKEE